MNDRCYKGFVYVLFHFLKPFENRRCVTLRYLTLDILYVICYFLNKLKCNFKHNELSPFRWTWFLYRRISNKWSRPTTDTMLGPSSLDLVHSNRQKVVKLCSYNKKEKMQPLISSSVDAPDSYCTNKWRIKGLLQTRSFLCFINDIAFSGNGNVLKRSARKTHSALICI